MAHRLALYRSDGTRIDLLTSPWKLVDRSWQTETCKPNVKYDHTTFGHQPSFQYYDSVIESFSVIATDTIGNLLYQLKRLEDVLDEIRQYHDRKPAAEQWWLEWHVDGEEERRALLYTGQMEYPSMVGISPMIECTTIIVKFAFVRHPLWENTTTSVATDTVDGPTTTGISPGGVGGDKMILTNVEGAAPARMEYVQVGVNADATLTPMQEYWIGIRPYHDGVANFDPLWQAEAGTPATNTAITADASASRGSMMRTTFVDTSLVKRFHVRLEDVVAFVGREVDYIGRYLVLARCTTTAAGTTIGVQMRSGYSDQIVHEEIYVESASWFLYELGEIEIPPASDPVMYYHNWLRSFMVSIYAERLAGAGNLDIDFLYLVPTEHFLHVSGSIIHYELPAPNTADVIYTVANDTNFAIGYTKAIPDSVNDALAIVPLNWYMPQEGGALVIIAQGETVHPLDVTMLVYIYYYPRWLSYRYDEET